MLVVKSKNIFKEYKTVPNIKSAIKRVETNKKKNAENRPILTAVKNSIKTINSYIDTNNIEDAEKYLPTLMSVLDSAVAKGIIHRNNASNKISAISQRISDVKNGKKVVEIKKDNKTIAAEKAKAAKLAREEAKKAKAEVVEEKAE
ncbi:MAG: 30S ribosomal protein S20 [Clostridiales bacterium]|nr:30S ribosomal protein S20 [Clostridiales bacterium]